MLSANWRRGLIRFWIVTSFVWLVGAGAVLQKDIRSDVSTLNSAETKLQEAERALANADKAPSESLSVKRRAARSDLCHTAGARRQLTGSRPVRNRHNGGGHPWLDDPW